MFNAKVYAMLKYLKILHAKVVERFIRVHKLLEICNSELKWPTALGQGIGNQNCIHSFHPANIMERLAREAMERYIWSNI